MVVFDEMNGENNTTALEFRYAKFWFHFHNIPNVCSNRKYAVALANSVGKFEEVETDEEGHHWGKTLRVKVKLDINKPLRRGTYLIIGASEKEKWIPITIEKLPDFCYMCGKLGHVLKECDEKNGTEEEEPQYGVWMRASGRHGQGPKLKKVTGKE